MVLFLCESNSSMSPMAEAIFRHVLPGVPVQSAGKYTSHVRQPVREVLREDGVDDFGLSSKDLFGVDLSEVLVVIGLGLPDRQWVMPSRLTIEWWVLPDPSCFSEKDELDSYRALRDELTRRIKSLLKEKRLFP